MPPFIYPEPTWSGQFNRVVRTLQVVAIAGTIGALGGGVAVLTLTSAPSDGRSTKQPAVLADAGNASQPAQPNAAALVQQRPVAFADAQAVAPTGRAAFDMAEAPPQPIGRAAFAEPPLQPAAARVRAAFGGPPPKRLYDRADPGIADAATPEPNAARDGVTPPIAKPKHARRNTASKPAVAANNPPAQPPVRPAPIVVLPDRSAPPSDGGGWHGGLFGGGSWGNGGRPGWSGGNWGRSDW